jgi:hypothetical protein
VIEFIVELSEIDKVKYGDGGCYALLEPLLCDGIAYDDLFLLYRFEQIDVKCTNKPLQTKR